MQPELSDDELDALLGPDEFDDQHHEDIPGHWDDLCDVETESHVTHEVEQTPGPKRTGT